MYECEQSVDLILFLLGYFPQNNGVFSGFRVKSGLFLSRTPTPGALNGKVAILDPFIHFMQTVRGVWRFFWLSSCKRLFERKCRVRKYLILGT